MAIPNFILQRLVKVRSIFPFPWFEGNRFIRCFVSKSYGNWKIFLCHIAGCMSVQITVYRKLNVFVNIVIKFGILSPPQNILMKKFIQYIPFTKFLQDSKRNTPQLARYCLWMFLRKYLNYCLLFLIKYPVLVSFYVNLTQSRLFERPSIKIIHKIGL